MRVIAGSAKGCGLAAPKGLDTRPTADRQKENLFNLLTHFIPDSQFLDLFSGSGAIGIEALSRGAREAVLVEHASAALDAIRQNLNKTKLQERAEVMPLPVKRALEGLSAAQRRFDVIFMDPPYAGTMVSETITQLAQTGLLAEDGILAAEMPAQINVPLHEAFTVLKIRKYGHTQIVLYKVTDR